MKQTKESPAVIEFTLRGSQAGLARLEYSLDVAEEGEAQEFILIQELQAVDLNISKAGALNQVAWQFAQDPQLGSGFTGELIVQVTLGNGSIADTDDSLSLSVGNDPPEILGVEIPDPAPHEVVGIVDIPFVVADTDELVDVRIEVNVDEAGGFPEGAWKFALPGGLDTGTPPPDPTVPDVLAAPAQAGGT